MTTESVVREFVEQHPDPLEVDIAASQQVRGPLSIKLTLTWSGSVSGALGRLTDWKIVRMLLE
ncbi:MAG: hypothetical protein EXQ55_09000 [Acidobacteria bacterium]|nr:hypothetical protein [Acidobacteriota bacterium]